MTDSCPFHPVLREFNPFEPSQAQDPYPMYAHAREHAPVFFSPVLNMWVATRHQDICDILRDHARFSSCEAAGAVPSLPPEALAVLAEGLPQTSLLLQSDPPVHTRLRRIANKALTAQRMAQMEPRIRQLANALVDRFVHARQADLVKEFSHPLPGLVIGSLLDVPEADIETFVRWSHEWVKMLFVIDLPVEQQIIGARGYVALQKYAAKMIAQRREEPRDDMLTDLIHARADDGSTLTTPELVGTVTGILAAGHLTTSDFLGSAILWLLKEPERWQALCLEPSLAPKIVEEVLRRDPPVTGLMRTTTEDVTINGASIPKGSRILVLYPSGNNDEAVFHDPGRFDIERDNLRKTLAFGHGIHFCIGAPLARLEGRIALEVLSERLPNLRFQPGATVTYTPNLGFRGPAQLNLMWDE